MDRQPWALVDGAVGLPARGSGFELLRQGMDAGGQSPQRQGAVEAPSQSRLKNKEAPASSSLLPQQASSPGPALCPSFLSTKGLKAYVCTQG